MRTPPIPEAGPKRKLLDAAEQLFAERGFDAVSVRDITKLAGANVAAVNYHFGSREGLVAMVMTRYLIPVAQDRLTLLNEAEKRAGGRPVPVDEIIIAMSKPLIDQVKKSRMSECVFCKLLGRVLSEQTHEMTAAVEEQIRPAAIRFNEALGKALPHLSAVEIAWRLHFVYGGMIHMLSFQEMFRRMMGIPDAPMEETFDRFVRFAVAAICQNPAPSGMDAPAVKALQSSFDL